MIILTGACNGYYYSLRQLINNLKGMGKGDHHKFFIFNLGMSEHRWEFIKSRPNLDKRFIFIDRLPWTKYPAHFKDLQTYAFKSMCFDLIKEDIKDQVVMWMDSACLLERELGITEYLIKEKVIYTPYSAENIARYCHPATIERMGYKGSLDNTMRSGGLLGIDLSKEAGKNFLSDYKMIMKYENIVCPLGSNKSNHRQDQSVLTLMYWRGVEEGHIEPEDRWIGLSFHNNIFNNE
tara:strand:- start:76 stop:783 length:708 start_codon:yes stop_codon:yes gene_type:complete